MKLIVFMIGVSFVCLSIYAADELADPTLPGSGTIIELEKGGEQNTDGIAVNEESIVEQQTENIDQPEQAPNSDLQKHNNDIYTVQLGAFKARERAFALYWDMSKKVTPLQVTAPMPKDKLYRVRYGSYPNREEAKVAAEKLRKKGVECFVATLKTMEIIPIEEK